MIVSLDYFKTVIKQFTNKINELRDKISQSDWNVNDETDAAYIKNRICYASETLVDVIAETVVSAEMESDYNFYLTWNQNFSSLNATSNITVICDGVTYKNVSITVEEVYLGGGNYVYHKSIGGIPDYPFLLTDSRATFKTRGTHTISVKYPDVVYKKIEPEYLDICDNYLSWEENPTNTTKIVTSNVLYGLKNNINAQNGVRYFSFTYSDANGASLDTSFDNLKQVIDSGKKVMLYESSNGLVYQLYRRGSDYFDFINFGCSLDDDGGLHYIIASVVQIMSSNNINYRSEEIYNRYQLTLSTQENSVSQRKKFKITVDDSGTISATEITT